ncbi:metallophosphoesterase [Pyrolobus fumarii 1A]|uniref:Metallophosphoesterase n=1 Tax=Pyrolobus fumarii (strain DSM 11204 / 1A) TaxID=694429 RepID=G0EHG3_PYRF1|nr:metallophosphoesterase family protein [Pyrolobus fumarii]AEM38538.1 metallophosphoesterase [Pyrolobus fumarii 1A]
MHTNTTILHLSDIHVGSPHFSKDLAENVIAYVNDVKPDVIVITGDLTDNGYVHEYRGVVELLSKLDTKKLLVVPGNHDARNMGYVVFERVFGSRFPILEYNGVCIQGVDSSEPDVDDGHIGRLAYDLVSQNLSRCKGFRIVALHHHLIPVPGTGRERNIPVDAGDFLKLLLDMGVNLVLSGHKHVPWLWEINGMVILHAGTATTLRLKAGVPPSLNVIEVTKDEIMIKRVETRKLKEAVIYRGYPQPREPLPVSTSDDLLRELEEAVQNLRDKNARISFNTRHTTSNEPYTKCTRHSSRA